MMESSEILLIFLEKVNSRNRYCFNTVLRTFLNFQDFKLTSSKEEFEEYQGPKLSYSTDPIQNELHFKADGLLDKKGISEVKVEIGEHQNIPTIFHLSNASKSSLPFDAFAAIFYMLSRYEEYLPHLRDHYDRFLASEGIAAKNNFLQIAVVDRWVLMIREILIRHFPELKIPERRYQHIPTIDIDNAYAYIEKGIIRQIASLLRSVYNLNWNKLGNQIEVLLGRKKDPFDTYHYQLNVQKKFNIRPIYFFLLADYGINDKNISYQNRRFQALIKRLADYAEVGIHPSFASNANKNKVGSETRRLSRIVKREIYRSRQHFLKLTFPETYRNLIDQDIQEDYTMGFAEQNGFRAGTCTPYLFYDLDEELERKLLIFPFQLMDATLKYYKNYSPDQALMEMQEIIDEVKAVQGTFISLWHNESLSDQDIWQGWRNVYEEMLSYAG